jgi:hypothetical protein
MTDSGAVSVPTNSSALLELLESFERLVDTVETELDDDSREGSTLTGEAWAEACQRILARARDSKRAMDRPDVLAALGQ